mmetsp:Transcript_7336/g.18765  ORF Transcript_7336/g.18765 Transcript_7336/m.18765 type:complete len:231 (-) Transcript_7336:1162-1854(-)
MALVAQLRALMAARLPASSGAISQPSGTGRNSFWHPSDARAGFFMSSEAYSLSPCLYEDTSPSSTACPQCWYRITASLSSWSRWGQLGGSSPASRRAATLFAAHWDASVEPGGALKPSLHAVLEPSPGQKLPLGHPLHVLPAPEPWSKVPGSHAQSPGPLLPAGALLLAGQLFAGASPPRQNLPAGHGLHDPGDPYSPATQDWRQSPASSDPGGLSVPTGHRRLAFSPGQ